MTSLTINPKFNIGETVFLIEKKPQRLQCNVCEGNKKIEYKDKYMTCPECMGTGYLSTQRDLNTVEDNGYIIKSIKATIDAYSVTFRYTIGSNLKTLKRAEENIYASIEDAQKQCDYLNKERKYISIDDIKIPYCFACTIPSSDKITKRIEEYKTTGFRNDIIVDNENTLIDGYTTYLVSKMFSKDNVKVVVN